MACVFAAVSSSCSMDRVVNAIESGRQKPEGEIVSKSYEFDDIRSIDTSSGIYVYYTYGPDVDPVRVEGPSDVLDALEIECDKDGELELSFKGNKRFRYSSKEQHVHVYVTAPEIREFEASSGGIIEADGAVTVDGTLSAGVSSGAYVNLGSVKAAKVKLESTSGGMLEIADVTAEELKAEASSGSQIKVAGVANSASLQASSGGSVDAPKLEARYGSAKASSGGSVRSAIKAAQIERSSGGSVRNRAE